MIDDMAISDVQRNGIFLGFWVGKLWTVRRTVNTEQANTSIEATWWLYIIPFLAICSWPRILERIVWRECRTLI
jgi:hypothetical protein